MLGSARLDVTVFIAASRRIAGFESLEMILLLK
jgi:hypothetical protein